MHIEDVLIAAAEAARSRRRADYRVETGRDPDGVERPVLIGYCYENARELSYELFERHVPHRIVYGGILVDFVENVPTLAARDALEDVVETDYRHPDGGYDPAIWEEVPKPETRREIPDEINHYWIEVDASEAPFSGRGTWHAEIAAEARPHYGEVYVREGHPDHHYIRPEDATEVNPWTRDDEWQWHPETLEWLD